MHCPKCNTPNDQDASFCIECGKPISAAVESPSVKSRKSYLLLLALLPVLLLVAGIGYYKFFLPDGIAAVVNGEEITLSELDAEVSRVQRQGEAGQLRRQALFSLIDERLALQEARKSGFQVSGDELSCAIAQARASSGMDGAAFHGQITTQYGSMAAYEDFLKHQLLMEKFIHAKVVPPETDPQAARIAVERWMQDLSSRALVRISLSEQGPASGCGCCNRESGQAPSREGMPGRVSASGKQAATDQGKTTAEACLRYWRAKHGPEPVTARPTDFGCHVRVDIIKNGEIIGSLRYRDGSITEM